jgi:hypothetical protein
MKLVHVILETQQELPEVAFETSGQVSPLRMGDDGVKVRGIQLQDSVAMDP